MALEGNSLAGKHSQSLIFFHLPRNTYFQYVADNIDNFWSNQDTNNISTRHRCEILTSVIIKKEFYYAGIRLLTVFPYEQWFTSWYKSIYASHKRLFITSFRMCTRIFALSGNWLLVSIPIDTCIWNNYIMARNFAHPWLSSIKNV